MLCLAFASPASADCVSDCQASVSCETGRQWECSRELSECYSRCAGSGSSTPPKRFAGAHGAIAYDAESGAWGLADPATDAASAKQSALAYCAKHGHGCEIVESFANACAAVAADTGDALDWAIDADRATAATKAIAKCGAKSKSGPRCFVRLLRCYSPE